MINMAFGKIKTYIENKLIESYNDGTEFKKTLNEFKQNVLMNKQISKVYSLYDQLSTPQGLSESDAKEYLEEGIFLLKELMSSIRLPKLPKDVDSEYKDLDTLINFNRVDIKERVESKKNIINILTKSPNVVKENLNLPLKSMVSIANQTINSFVENMTEENKKEFLKIISEDTDVLVENYKNLKDSTIEKINSLIESNIEYELKDKLIETIDKLSNEEFNQINYLKLKTLSESI
mgnify:CR=1 FL=1